MAYKNSPDFAIAPSSMHGVGLFAAQPLEKNCLITFYDGEHISWDEAQVRDPDYIRTICSQHHAIDGLRAPVDGRGAASLANHSDRPNARYWWHDDAVWIKTMRDINVGEEVLVNYGRHYWLRKQRASATGKQVTLCRRSDHLLHQDV